MATVDLIFVVIAGISSLIGAIRGLMREAVALATWVAAILIAGILSPQMSLLMTDMIENESLRRIVAFVLLFVLTIFVGTLIGNLVSKLTKAAGLRGTDRLLGALFGVLRGAAIIVVFVLVTMPFEFSRGWYDDSILVPYITPIGEWLQNLLNDPGDTVA